MNRWRKFWNDLARQRATKTNRRPQLLLENLESRELLNAAPVVPAPDQHVLLLSVDGLHNADLADPQLQSSLTNIENLQDNGVTYSNAYTTSPSDSFPGTLAYLTGANPGTTGVFYDDSYSRTLLPPGSNSNAAPGTEATYFEAIDKNSALLSGGGNFDASSIDPTKLPINPQTNQVVYPNQFLQTNTIFDVASQAGLYTAFSDKHPSYQIADGNNPAAINDFYAPEINSTTALLDNTTGKTVDAAALLNGGAPAATNLTVAPGYTAKVFSAAPPSGSSAPDSITVDGLNVYVGYGNGGNPDGSGGAMSTIVQYTDDGKFVQSWTVAGHNDGLKVDPNTHLLWAIQNEDANPNLVVINPVTRATATYALPPVNGGGYDDLVFLGGKVFVSASNPANNPNTDPAVVQLTFNGATAQVTPVLLGNAAAINTVTGQAVTLNLQDPDSMTADANGNLVLTSQADNELVTIHNPGLANQSVTVTPLSDAAKNPVSVDDTLFTPGAVGEVLVTDQSTGAIYVITVPAGSAPEALSAGSTGQVGVVNTTTGVFTPVISGLGSPKGLAFINAGAFTDLSNYTLVDPSTDPQGANDPNLINDTTKNVLLTEKYDDLKVAAILNEIKGLPSHTFTNSDLSKIPAIFGMNFQAVSVAEKDANGGIAQLPNGQEGAPSAILEGALQHTDQSIGKIVQALKDAGIYNSTELYVFAKHGQAPRVGHAGLMADSTLPDLLNNAGDTVAQATQDDVSLIWLKDQSKTADAVRQLQNFKDTGTINVFFQGVEQTLPASQVIDKILYGQALVNSGLGNPAKDSTTPDIIVTLKPGYIWVGNPLNFAHKNAEHGGFSEDDTHVALVVAGGIPADLKGTVNSQHVDTTQIAVSTLDALGLDPSKLTGAVKDGTQALPGLAQNQGVGKDALVVQKQADADAQTAKTAQEAAQDIGQFHTVAQVTGALDRLTRFAQDTASDLTAIGAELEKIADGTAGNDPLADLLQATDKVVADAQKTIDRIKDTTAKIDALLDGVKGGTIPDKVQDQIDKYASQIAKDEATLESDDDVIAADAEKIADLVGGAAKP